MVKARDRYKANPCGKKKRSTEYRPHRDVEGDKNTRNREGED